MHNHNGWIDGPRIFAAGALALLGGLMMYSGMKPELWTQYVLSTTVMAPYDCSARRVTPVKYGWAES